MESKSNWRSVTRNPPPVGEYVLIKTVTGLVRVAKYVLYNNSTESWTYSSTYYKNVMWWQPLPK